MLFKCIYQLVYLGYFQFGAIIKISTMYLSFGRYLLRSETARVPMFNFNWEHIAIFQNSHCNHVLSYQQQRIPPALHLHQLMVWPVLFLLSSFVPHNKRNIVLFCPLFGHVNSGDWWVQYLPWSITLNSVVSLHN